MKRTGTTLSLLLLISCSNRAMQQPTLLKTAVALCTGLALTTAPYTEAAFPSAACPATTLYSNLCQYKLEEKYKYIINLLDSTDAQPDNEVAKGKICMRHLRYTEKRNSDGIQVTMAKKITDIPVSNNIYNYFSGLSNSLVFDDMEPNTLRKDSFFRRFIRNLAKQLGRKTSQGLVVATDPVAELEEKITIPQGISAENNCDSTIMMHVYDFEKIT